MHRARTMVAFVVLMLTSPGVVPPVHGASPDPAAPGALKRVTEGTLWWRTRRHPAPTPAPTLATDVEIRVTGILVRATVRQSFTNPSQEWAEGLYVFPLPEDAAVDHLRLQVGERVVEGVIQEREAAKATYEAAKGQGRQTSLVEQERPNVFTTSVANIAPGATIGVEIEYQQALRLDQGRLRLRFPLLVGPRYIPGHDAPGAGATAGSGWAENTDEVPDASRITPPVADPSLGPINPVTITVDLAAGVPLARVESPYHTITTTSLGGDRYHVTLAEGVVPANRDFELVWEPVATAVPATAVLTETTEHGVFGLVMMLPPIETSDWRRVPREAIFVIDTSGSMAGASIDQAKGALALALGRLQPDDTFNVVQFNSVANSVFPAALPASAANLARAQSYVARLHATGGTEMLPALTLALHAQAPPGRLRQVIFLTDGQVGNEARIFELIRARLGESRLFTIGIGATPNSHVMRESARLGRGTFTHIGSPTEVQEKMDALFRKIETPALTDIQLEFPGGTPMEMFPARVPDLYLGEPIVLALRADALPPRALLRGRLGPRPWTQEVWLQDTRAGAGLSVHWARAKIAELLDRKRPGENDDEIRAAVLEVALTHHLVSPHTSLVAVDVTPVRASNEPLISHALETDAPDGWDVAMLGQGATDARLHLLLGMTALGLAAALVARSRRRALLEGPRRAR
jgi:Ca-activated chloride channel family protein